MMFILVELCVVVECLLAKKLICVVGVVGLCRRGAWMFAEMLIHFHFGKFLH